MDAWNERFFRGFWDGIRFNRDYGGFGVGAGSEPALTMAPWVKTAPKTLAATTSSQILHPGNPTPPGRKHGLPEIVGQLKTFSARRINKFRHTPGVAVWQRNYYEHIIRDVDELVQHQNKK